MSKKYIYLRNAMYMLGGADVISGLALLVYYFEPMQKFLFSLDFWIAVLIFISVISVWIIIALVLFTVADFINDYGKEHPYVIKKNRRTIDFK